MELNKNTNKILIIYSTMLIVGLIISFFSGNIIGGDQHIIELSSEKFNPTMQTRNIYVNEAQPYIYEATFSKADLKGQEENLGILIPRFASNGYKVFLNGTIIGQNGSMNKGMSNLWNGVEYYLFPDLLIKDNNTIRIESISHYKTGLTTHPTYITEVENGLSFQFWFNAFNTNTIFVGIGILLLGGILLIALYFLTEVYKEVLLYLSASLIFMAIYVIDYTSISYLPISYFIYKRIIIISFWTSSLFLGISMYKILKSRIALFAAILSWIGIVLIAFFAPDIIFFKKAYGIWYFTLIANVVVWMIVSFKLYKKNFEARILFWGYLVLFIYSLINLLLDSIGIFFSMNSPVIYIAVLSIMPLMLIYFDAQQNKNMLLIETSMRKMADKKAYKDALTGVYNLHYFTTKIQKLVPPYTIVMFDFDNFKIINDIYGHKAGDEVLKYVTNSFDSYYREGDILCRIGGDEFAVLISADKEIVKRRMEEFSLFVANSIITYKEHEMKITLSIGIFYVEGNEEMDEIFNKADKALYAAKQKGKNTVCVYEEF